MVSTLTRPHRPRHGVLAPLRERWEQARDKLSRAAPQGHPALSALGLPMSEHTIDELEDALARVLKDKVVPDDPLLRSASQEVWQLKADFNKISFPLTQPQHQSWLTYAPTDWRHKLLGLSPDIFTQVGTYDLAVGSGGFTSVHEAKAAARQMFANLQWLRSIENQINTAKAFEVQPQGNQALDLVEALYKKHIALTERVLKLEAKCSAVEAKLARQQKAAKEKAA